MNRLFGTSKPAAPKPTLQDASASMDKRGESLDQKIMKLDKELARYTEQMKKMRPGPAKQAVQKRALTILKQKKMYEGQKEKTMNQQFNMEQIMFAQEGLKETADTVKAMKGANKDLKKQFKSININQVEDLQDDMSDLLEQAEEVQNALARSYNTDDVDEADLEAELAAMEDDPSLFLSSMGEGEAVGSADYLDLPASSSLPVEADASADVAPAMPAAQQQAT
uniref:Charged multivesicular body protein 5 n=1 Tax=Calcidiscus leptoporus TaxID=127549 RepID=A0A7S0P4K3_9EUKA|mmetsp:Transcript_54118/g.124605  ORF Transcript_54118/g.124605 Transcript_54118/m.124605 type:complete len:224 (+) Transcript_54118:89-760(+)